MLRAPLGALTEAKHSGVRLRAELVRAYRREHRKRDPLHAHDPRGACHQHIRARPTRVPRRGHLGCVTRGELRNTRINTTLLTLENRYETSGRLESQGGGYKAKSYRACYGGDYARVWITYRHHHDAWRVNDKWYMNP